MNNKIIPNFSLSKFHKFQFISFIYFGLNLVLSISPSSCNVLAVNVVIFTLYFKFLCLCIQQNAFVYSLTVLQLYTMHIELPICSSPFSLGTLNNPLPYMHTYTYDLFLIFFFMCMSLFPVCLCHMHVVVVFRIQKKVSDLRELEFQVVVGCSTWRQGSKFRSQGKTTCCLSSPLPFLCVFQQLMSSHKGLCILGLG